MTHLFFRPETLVTNTNPSPSLNSPSRMRGIVHILSSFSFPISTAGSRLVSGKFLADWRNHASHATLGPVPPCFPPHRALGNEIDKPRSGPRHAGNVPLSAVYSQGGYFLSYTLYKVYDAGGKYDHEENNTAKKGAAEYCHPQKDATSRGPLYDATLVAAARVRRHFR